MLELFSFIIIFTSAMFWEPPIDSKGRQKKRGFFFDGSQDFGSGFKNLLIRPRGFSVYYAKSTHNSGILGGVVEEKRGLKGKPPYRGVRRQLCEVLKCQTVREYPE